MTAASAQADTPYMAPGAVVGDRFEIVGVLGEGGMGVVYRARDRMSDQPAAVKVLKRQLIQSKEFVGRFKREARAASRFRHDAAVRIIATGETEDRLPFIAMELIEGVELEEIIAAEAPLATGRAANLAEQLLRALGAAHKQGIVHRDVKPSNIRVVVDADGVEHPKLLDFGVAKFVRGDMGDVTGGFKTKTGVILGTPKYMSPEQIRGEAIDGRADIYAVGAMLHEMVTGKPPFAANDVFGFVALHLKQELLPITQRFPEIDLAPEVDDIVLRMLNKDPKDRPEDAEILGEELSAWSVADPGASRKAVELRRGVIAVAIGGLLGAVAAFFLAPAVAAPAAAASVGLGAGAAIAAARFGRPSVYSYVKRVGAVLTALVVTCGASVLLVPDNPGFVVAAAFVLAGLIIYAGFLLVWSAPLKLLRLAVAGIAAPLLCVALFPVRVDPVTQDAYFLDVLGIYPAVEARPATAADPAAAKQHTALALLAVGLLFGASSILLPRPGAARKA